MAAADPQTLESTMLVITGVAVDPDQVTVSLGLAPQQVWRKGQKKTYKLADGRVRELDSIHDRSGWKCWLEEPDSTRELCHQLWHWAKTLEPHARVIDLLKQNGAAVVLDCFITTSGVVGVAISSELQERLGKLGVDLELSFHSHPAE
jgi:hypothetical protein